MTDTDKDSRIKALEDALRPFAEVGKEISETMFCRYPITVIVEAGDLRRAAQVMEGE